VPDPPWRTRRPQEREEGFSGFLAAAERSLITALVVGVGCVTLGVSAGLLFRAAGAPAALPPVPVAAPGVPEAAPTSPEGAEPLARRSFLSRLLPPSSEPIRAPRTPRGVEAVARGMTAERKVAQLMLVGFRGTDQTSSVFRDLRERDLGGVVVESRNYANATQLATLLSGVFTVARESRHISPFVLTAQEGGTYSEIDGIPPTRAPGELDSPRAAARAAGAAARSLKLLGINGVLAPVIDVGTEGAGGGGNRLYSDDPDAVADFAAATITAYRKEGLLVAPKHFPGLGAATQPTEAGPATVGLSVRELAQRDLRPFAAAVDARVPAMVVGHGLYPSDDYALPASLSRRMSTALLRRELRFGGVAITDDLASPGLDGATSSIPDAAVDALRAGADMVWISGDRGDQEAAYVAVLNAVRKGEISRRRLDEALMRVLRAKGELRLIR
jgi:beta-N-acetylhexosaminidase